MVVAGVVAAGDRRAQGLRRGIEDPHRHVQRAGVEREAHLGAMARRQAVAGVDLEEGVQRLRASPDGLVERPVEMHPLVRHQHHGLRRRRGLRQQLGLGLASEHGRQAKRRPPPAPYRPRDCGPWALRFVQALRYAEGAMPKWARKALEKCAELEKPNCSARSVSEGTDALSCERRRIAQASMRWRWM